MKKGLNIIVVLLIVVLLLVAFRESGYIPGTDENSLPHIKVGAILPLSGPGAIWGEAMKDGIELALSELGDDRVRVIYEDSETQAAKGISSYNKLVDVDGVDVVFSAISRVSVPLIPLADEDEIPLIMSLVAAEGVTQESPYAFRLFPNTTQWGAVHFEYLDAQGLDNIAVLYVNDEYGKSVNQAIGREATRRGMTLVAMESYLPTDSDFRTQLTKIKEADAEALLFIGIPPAGLISSVKQARELGLGIPFFENGGSLLTIPPIREQLESSDEGLFTTALSSTLGRTGNEYVTKHVQKYDRPPLWATSYGYDVVMLIEEAMVGTGETFRDRIASVNSFESVNGTITQTIEGEINPEIYTAQVQAGKIEAVE